MNKFMGVVVGFLVTGVLLIIEGVFICTVAAGARNHEGEVAVMGFIVGIPLAIYLGTRAASSFWKNER